MGSNSGRKSGSSGRSTPRKRVVIGAEETVRVRYRRDVPEVESERRSARSGPRTSDIKTPKRSTGAGKRLAKAKRVERERRQQSLRLKRSAAWVGIGVIAVALIVGLVALYRAPIFTVEKTSVTGNTHLTDAQLVALARVPADATLLRLPARAIERRLLTNPWITDVKVHRSYPHTLVLAVTERQPAAVVDGGGKNVWVVSRDGHWLGLRSVEDTSLPIIRNIPELRAKVGAQVTSREILNAIGVIKGLSPDLLSKVEVINAPAVADTALNTHDGVEIFIGQATEMITKDRIVKAILAREKGVVYVNVRVTDRPTWRGLDQNK